MKLQLIALILLFLSSCTKYLEVDAEPQPAKIVVNCLFSPDRNWDIKLTKTKDIIDHADVYIDHAQVEIHTESDQVIFLNHNGKGHYVADSKPIPNEVYQLIVDVSGYEPITAQSLIPASPQASVENLEIDWAKYMYPNDLMDYDVFPLTVDFDDQPKQGYFLFRAHNFNPEYGYLRYKLSSSSLAELEKRGIPEEGIQRLSLLADEWQLGTQIFYSKMNDLGDITERNYFNNLISQELQTKKVSTREYEAFLPVSCFANDEWLTNISYDTHTVMGKDQSINQAHLLYSEPNLRYAMESGNKQGREYWLEVTQGDQNFYEYYRTYILQVSQRINPYSEPVSVYSNIQNGIGIFAGYHRQMIHLLTY